MKNLKIGLQYMHVRCLCVTAGKITFSFVARVQTFLKIIL